jgi:hypothetical protein
MALAAGALAATSHAYGLATPATAGAGTRAERLELTVLGDGAEDELADAVLAQAQAEGGYLKERAGLRLELRVPHAAVPALVAWLEAHGKVVERNVEASDLTAERAGLAAQIATRETMLHDYLGGLSTAPSREDLATIQVASLDLIEQVEKAKGRLRVLDHAAQFAAVEVSLRLRERRSVRASRGNDIGWLNGVDLGSLLSDFSQEDR